MFGTLFYSSCTKCPTTLPFLDIKEIEIDLGETNLNTGEALEFTLRYERIQYLSSRICFPNMLSAAYAASTCEPDGQLGLKYPVISIDVNANLPWDSQHPPGASLKDFLEISVIDPQSGQASFVNMNDYINSMPNGFDPEDASFRLMPGSNIEGNVFLSLTLTKSDASVIIKNLPLISWN